LFRASELVGS